MELRNKGILALGVVAFLLSGCETIGQINNPIRTNNLGDIRLAAMKAEERAIIASIDPVSKTYRVCAEPPPDAASNLAKSISAAIQAEVGKPGKSAGVALVAANNLARSVERIYSRSHAVQLFRDASFSLCQAYLIGASRDNRTEELDEANKKLDELDDRLEKIDVRRSQLLDEEFDIEDSLFARGIDIERMSREERKQLELSNDEYGSVKKESRELDGESDLLISRKRELESRVVAISRQTRSYLTAFNTLMERVTTVLNTEVQELYNAELIEAKTKNEVGQVDKVSIDDILSTVSNLTTAQANALVEALNKMPKKDTVVCDEGEKKNNDGECEKEQVIADAEGNAIADSGSVSDAKPECEENQVKDKDGKCIDKPDIATSEETGTCPEGQVLNEEKQGVTDE